MTDGGRGATGQSVGQRLAADVDQQNAEDEDHKEEGGGDLVVAVGGKSGLCPQQTGAKFGRFARPPTSGQAAAIGNGVHFAVVCCRVVLVIVVVVVVVEKLQLSLGEFIVFLWFTAATVVVSVARLGRSTGHGLLAVGRIMYEIVIADFGQCLGTIRDGWWKENG